MMTRTTTSMVRCPAALRRPVLGTRGRAVDARRDGGDRSDSESESLPLSGSWWHARRCSWAAQAGGPGPQPRLPAQIEARPARELEARRRAGPELATVNPAASCQCQWPAASCRLRVRVGLGVRVGREPLAWHAGRRDTGTGTATGTRGGNRDHDDPKRAAGSCASRNLTCGRRRRSQACQAEAIVPVPWVSDTSAPQVSCVCLARPGPP